MGASEALAPYVMETLPGNGQYLGKYNFDRPSPGFQS